MSRGARKIFTRTMLSGENLTIEAEQGIATISVLCKVGVVKIQGNLNAGTIVSNDIQLTANESLTVTGAAGFDIQYLDITTDSGASAIVTGA